MPVAGGTRTLCVRLCDGYYFPIEFDASSSRFDTDAAACQSMYAQDGQAELFVQANNDDVANATSLSGQRYGDQPYAFCLSPELCAGLRRPVARRPVGAGRALLRPAAAAAARLPRYRASPCRSRRCAGPISEDPETLANAAGHFTVKPVAPPRVALAGDAPAKHVRMVGPAYYADMFDLSKVRKKQESLRSTFSIVTPAAAEEKAAAEPAVDDPDTPAGADASRPGGGLAPPHRRHSFGQNMPACWR